MERQSISHDLRPAVIQTDIYQNITAPCTFTNPHNKWKSCQHSPKKMTNQGNHAYMTHCGPLKWFHRTDYVLQTTFKNFDGPLILKTVLHNTL